MFFAVFLWYGRYVFVIAVKWWMQLFCAFEQDLTKKRKRKIVERKVASISACKCVNVRVSVSEYEWVWVSVWECVWVCVSVCECVWVCVSVCECEWVSVSVCECVCLSECEWVSVCISLESANDFSVRYGLLRKMFWNVRSYGFTLSHTHIHAFFLFPTKT